MRIKTAIIGVLFACLLTPAAAGAASSDEILRDCSDGQIDGSYTREEVERARGDIPSDLEEYSDCRGALEGARIDTSAGKPSGAGGGGSRGSTPSNAGNAEPADPQGPSESAVVDAATKKGGSAVRLGPGAAITPGATGIPTNADLRRSIPDSLLVVLILLGTVALVGAVLATRARVFARRLG